MEIKFFEDGKELSTHEIILDNIDNNENIITIVQCCVKGVPVKDIGSRLNAIEDMFKTYGIDVIPLAIPDKEHQYIFNQLQIKGEK